MLYGNGVTKNFLAILESELDRTAKRIIRLLILTGVVLLLAWPLFDPDALMGLGSTLAILVAAGGLGGVYAHYVANRRYNTSIKAHWNRWMRYSVSCVSVRECYRKVHNRNPGPSVLWVASLLSAVFIAHLVLLVYAIDTEATFNQILPLFALDAIILGFFIGKRIMERHWYRQFLRSVNELLREGQIGVWGVY
jgi:hypothetical protein